MRIEDFDYNLPLELIAQTPIEKRSNSKLMITSKEDGAIIHENFANIINYLQEGDVLVLNNTKVMPSRIFGLKEETNASIEMLLLKDCGYYYEVLAKKARRLNVGNIINFNNLFKGKIIKKLEDGLFHVEFSYQGVFLELLEKCGEVPLPPYIKEKLAQKSRYQTVYAKSLGSSAAPTAGLHFTEVLLENIKKKGVEIVEITLHIGLGTFRPVSVSNVLEHKMHSETYEITEDAAIILNGAKKQNRRIIACGTTSARTLEANISKYSEFKKSVEDTDIFIYPGYKFKAIDGLITNFHLPKSTLLMLVSAFSSKEIIFNCYQEAISNQYKFFSFGDAMFLI